MSRVVAFEGPDLTGKTSLLDLLQMRMPYAMWPRLAYKAPSGLLHSGQELDDTSLTFHEGLIVVSKQMPFVLDRCYVTNYVYGEEFGRKLDFARLESVAKRLRPVIVYVRTDPRILLDRLKWRGDDFIGKANPHRLESIAARYEEWLEANPWDDKVVVCDAGKHASKDEAVDWIDERLREEMGL